MLLAEDWVLFELFVVCFLVFFPGSRILLLRTKMKLF